MNRKTARPWWASPWLWLPPGLLLVFWAVRGVPVEEVIQVLVGLSPAQILALMAVNLLILGCFTLRWWLIVNAQGFPVSFRQVFLYRLAAFGVNYFTPGPQFGGEPLQVALLNRRHAMPLPAAVAAVTLDRLVELSLNFGFLAFGILSSLQFPIFASLPPLQLRLLGFGLLVFPVGYLALLWLGWTPLGSLLHLAASRWQMPAVIQKAAGFVYASERHVSGFCRSHPVPMAAAVLVSLAGWSLIVLEFGLTLRFLGLDFSAAQVVAVLTAARLAFLAPPPAGLGVLEGALLLAVTALGGIPAHAVSLALLIRARDISLGLLGLGWLALSVRRRQAPLN